jgi:hypothetical protein
MEQKNGCDCQICMLQCDVCNTRGCGMCNWCKKNNVPVCMDCKTTYENYLSMIEDNKDQSGTGIRWGTILCILIIIALAYYFWKKS